MKYRATRCVAAVHRKEKPADSSPVTANLEYLTMNDAAEHPGRLWSRLEYWVICLKHGIPSALVGTLHAAALWWSFTTTEHTAVPITPPAVIGRLIPPPPNIVKSAPLPAPVVPRPRPVRNPEPLTTHRALPPDAPPTERSVTALPELPANQRADVIPVTAAPAAVREQMASENKPLPVMPPRSDAEHLNNPTPAYPALSRRLREEGRVLLDVYILRDGSVGQIKLKHSSGFPRLDEVAIEAVRGWRFLPARRGDEPIPYWYVQPLDFRLNP